LFSLPNFLSFPNSVWERENNFAEIGGFGDKMKIKNLLIPALRLEFSDAMG
jgi:hypothetical protein